MKTENHPKSYSSHALEVLEFDRVRAIVASHADSEEGKAQLAEMYPLREAGKIRSLLAEVDEFMQALRFGDAPPGTGVTDIRRIFPLLKVQGYNIGAENLYTIAANLETARLVCEYFGERREKYPILSVIALGIDPCTDVENRIRRAILPDFTIDDNASPELRSIRKRLARAREVLRNLVEKTLAGLSDDIVSERIVTVRNNRFVIPVRDSMKNRVQGAVHDRSQTGRTLFIEPLASIEGNNTVSELEMAEQAEIHRILVELSALVGSSADALRLNQELLVRLDVIKAKARYGVRVQGAIPVIGDDPVIVIKKGRHPLLDMKFRKSGGGASVVPLDISIGESHVTIVVTGPNAGGKTVALKTVGLITIMALCGMPVSAMDGTRVFAPDGIFADIGDEQSIEDDLSTFSSHMRQIVNVIRNARHGSLVLLDELGGGTNPSDGEAIALAVLRKLTGLKALTVATTHHDGLKVFAHETDGVSNASMEFDNDNLRPTFVFKTGIPGSSYAFEIAARMGMPDDVLKDAESLAGGDRKTLEGLISEMEEHVRRADEERTAALDEKRRLESLRRDYEEKLDDIKTRKNALIGEAALESKRIIEDVNRRIESSIREIKEQKASHDAIVKAKTEVETLKKDVTDLSTKVVKKEPKKRQRISGVIAQGDAVWVQSLNSPATVLELLDGGKKARVIVGRSKASVVVGADDLFEDENREKKDKQIVQVNVRSSTVESLEIDLRGMTFDEARVPLDQFLDTMHLSGMEFARIIHGKGSGALRSKIASYLNSHPYVASQRLGEWNEGSYGVTVVTLKR